MGPTKIPTLVLVTMCLIISHDAAPSRDLGRIQSGSVCTAEMIPCDNGDGCIARTKWCDFEDDCKDGSDEKYCETATWWKTDPNKCKDKHFLCANGICVPLVARCDDYDDCKDGSDEECNDSEEDRSEENDEDQKGNIEYEVDETETNGDGIKPQVPSYGGSSPNDPQVKNSAPPEVPLPGSHSPSFPSHEIQPHHPTSTPCAPVTTPCCNAQPACNLSHPSSDNIQVPHYHPCPYIQNVCIQLQMLCSSMLSPWPCPNNQIPYQNNNSPHTQPCTPGVQSPCNPGIIPCPNTQQPGSPTPLPCRPHQPQAPCAPVSVPCSTPTPAPCSTPTPLPCATPIPPPCSTPTPTPVYFPPSTTTKTTRRFFPTIRPTKPTIKPMILTTSTTPVTPTSRSLPSPSTPTYNPPTPKPPCPNSPRTQCPHTQSPQCPHSPPSKCPNPPSTQCPNSPSSKCPNSPHVQCPNVPPSQCPNAVPSPCPNQPPSKCPNRPLSQCPNAPPSSPNGPPSKCPNAPPSPPNGSPSQCPNQPPSPCPNVPPSQCPNSPSQCPPNADPETPPNACCENSCDPPKIPNSPCQPLGPCTHVRDRTFNYPDVDYMDFQFIYHDYLERAKEWLLHTRNEYYGWGAGTPRGLILLSLMDHRLFSDFKSTDNGLMKKVLQVKLANELQVIPAVSKERRAQYLNAMLATNQNPRDFHGMDLVKKLREKVDFDVDQNMPINPFISLSLCLAGATEEPHKYPYYAMEWLVPASTDHRYQDMLSFAIMTLACYANDPDTQGKYQKEIDEAVGRLLERMDKDGSFGNKYSTGLAAQALLSVNTHGNWDAKRTLDLLASHQVEDGSFGNLMATYYIVPALSGKSLLHLLNTVCDSVEVQTEAPTTTTTTTTPEPTRYNEIRFSLYIGDKANSVSSMMMTIPVGTNLMEIMNEAQTNNSDYRFRYDVINSNVLIYSISGIPNDAERHVYWNLYVENVPRDTERTLISDEQLIAIGGIEKIFPEDGSHIIFHYKRI